MSTASGSGNRAGGNPRSIRAAEHLRAGQVGGQSVAFTLTREWQTGRDPHWPGDMG
jgi:hypothetical protein